MILNNNILLSPSILAADLTTIGVDSKKYDPDLVDLLHMDVMDDHYVPNLTYGADYIALLKQHVSIPLDVHLMIEAPEKTIQKYLDIDPWLITVHYESTRFPTRIMQLIREKGIKSGIALNPSTPVETIYDILPYLDVVLIMSVDPGFCGQAFLEIALEKISKLNSFIRKEGFTDTVSIQVDGGITRDNIALVVEAGARIIVSGSTVFKGGKVNENSKDLKELALSALK